MRIAQSAALKRDVRATWIMAMAINTAPQMEITLKAAINAITLIAAEGMTQAKLGTARIASLVLT